jgi:uncharacterized protein
MPINLYVTFYIITISAFSPVSSVISSSILIILTMDYVSRRHILVGTVGIYLLYDLGLAKLSIKATVLGATIVVGLLFGIGWGLLGYCPGTAIGAIGEGRWDGVWGGLGMLAGGALYAEAYPLVKQSLLTWGNLGMITLPGVLNVNHWFVIPVFVFAGVGLFFFEKNNF